MFIPYSTDAPIYHYPISTVILIVINVFCFFAFCTSFTSLEPVDPIAEALMLQFGSGLLPWQWFTAMFMHLDIMHLFGNMIFLWAFGLVLEGKVGNFVFPALYVTLGVVQAFVVQTVMLGSEGGALGASGVIFSLLALIVIFAPVNSFEVFTSFGFRFFTFEFPILGFGSFYVLMNILFFFIGGADMSSEFLHLIGFAVGVPVGLIMLTRGYVDCEGYDLISYWQNKQGEESDVGKKYIRERERKSIEHEKLTAQAQEHSNKQRIELQIGEAIREGKFDAAVALQRTLARNYPGSTWKQSELMAIVRGYLQQKEAAKAIVLIEENLHRLEGNRFQWECNLIKIWLQTNQPQKALGYLKGLNFAFYSHEEQLKLKQLAEEVTKRMKGNPKSA